MLKKSYQSYLTRKSKKSTKESAKAQVLVLNQVSEQRDMPVNKALNHQPLQMEMNYTQDDEKSKKESS